MGKFYVLLSVVTILGLLSEASGACKASAEKIGKKKKVFAKCLKKGYQPSTLEGCVSGSGKPKAKLLKKCKKVEKHLVSCGVSCIEKVDGKYGPFGEWGACSEVCGGGSQSRKRKCNNPAPSGGGADCVGDANGVQACNENACPVNGTWSAPGQWSACSATCGGGTQSRSKNCNNPAPANGGANCTGEASETQACNENACPVNGGWSAPGQWSACSATCGGGSQSRSKICNNPVPANGGTDCSGVAYETQACNENACPVNGGWSAPGQWSACSAACNGGTQSRSKICNNPAPENGGAACSGAASETQVCNTQGPTVHSIGCWTDSSNRAISGGIRLNGGVESCRAFAAANGWNTFAVQYGGQCFTNANAASQYYRYGGSGGCSSGLGGSWCQNVYQISC